MTFVTSMAIILLATAVGTLVNDYTRFGGDYLNDDELKASHN